MGWLGPWQEKFGDFPRTKSRGQQSGGRADFAFRHGFIGRWDGVIVKQQFLHESCPKGRGALDRQGVTHWAAVGIPKPDGDGVLLVESDRPGISKATAGAGF